MLLGLVLELVCGVVKKGILKKVAHIYMSNIHVPATLFDSLFLGTFSLGVLMASSSGLQLQLALAQS